MRDLERSAGVPLFTRSNHGVTLTAKGAEFQRRAQQIVSELSDMFDHSDAGYLHDVSLSVSMTKYSHIMESFTQTVRQHKDLPVYTHRLQEGDPCDVIEDVYNHRADVGVLHFGGSQQKNMQALFRDHHLIYCPLARMTPHILLSQFHPLLEQGKPVTLESLRDYGFIRYEDLCEDFLFDLCSKQSQLHFQDNPRKVYLASRASLLHLLSQTDFYSIGIQSFSMQQSFYHVVSIPIENGRGMLEFGYIYPLGARLNRITEEFLADLKARLTK